MRIASLPRQPLAFLPTPFTHLPRFSQLIDGPDIWIKRDDQTGLATGGNKARKLEFLLGDAKVRGSDVILTAGGPQSNHARMTAAAAAQLGMDAVLFMSGDEPDYLQGNYFLDKLLGAETLFMGDADPDEVMQEYGTTLRDRGRNPYIIPIGGSVPIGSVGYILAGFEMFGQAVSKAVGIDHVVMASGSGGTAAGLLIAISLMSPKTTLHAVCVSRSSEEISDIILGLTRDTLDMLDWDVDSPGDHLEVHDQYVGEGYAIATPEGIDAGMNLARTEGIPVDTTYTGKALAGLVGLSRNGRFGSNETVVFLHTGGVAALFDEAQKGTFQF